MPPVTQKSAFMAKFGAKAREVGAKAAQAPIDYGNERLPGGISNGVARLITAEFAQVGPGKPSSGKWYFRMAGVIVEPEFVEVNGVKVPVAGRQTSLMEMVEESKTQQGKVTTTEEHLFNIANEMRKIGGPEYDTTELEEAAKTLVTMCEDPVSGNPCGPYFRFSTRESPAQLNPDGGVKFAARVWEEWWGSKGLEHYSPPEAGDAVQDETPPATAPSANGAKLPAKQPPQHTTRIAKAPEPAPEDASAADSDYQLMEMVEAAAGDDDAAAQATEELTRLALEAGWTQEDVETADGWEAVAELIRNPKDADSEQPADDEPVTDEEVPADPVKGKVVMYQLLDAKGQPAKNPKTKKVLPPIQCEVVAVDKAKETVTLKQSEDGKTLYKSVPWDQLLPTDE